MFWDTYILTCWKGNKEYKFKGFGNKKRFYEFVNKYNHRCPICGEYVNQCPLPDHEVSIPPKVKHS